jgi:hypothetical protein
VRLTAVNGPLRVNADELDGLPEVCVRDVQRTVRALVDGRVGVLAVEPSRELLDRQSRPPRPGSAESARNAGSQSRSTHLHRICLTGTSDHSNRMCPIRSTSDLGACRRPDPLPTRAGMPYFPLSLAMDG